MALIEKENTSPNTEIKTRNALINRSIKTKTGARIERGITRAYTRTRTDTNTVQVRSKTRTSMIAAIKIKRKGAPPLIKTENTRVAVPPARIRIRTRAKTRNIITSPAQVLKIRTGKT